MRYAVVDKKTGKVENVIEWDGKSDISWLLSEYDIVPAHDPSTGEYIGDIGDYYDHTTKEFKRPVVIKVGGKAIFKGRVNVKEIRDVIAKNTAGKGPPIEVIYWEEAEQEGA